ncbi:MAG: hypothetical protein KDD55_00235 [Bdellovibrionales bacterium]|nr:hypothetical protein [Bdellovibrionales bacterium]
MVKENHPDDSARQFFGGCPRLEEQYRTIGKALEQFEKTNGRFRTPSPSSVKEFRQSLVFIPVEVLQSYLDDLLNLDVKPEQLFITHDAFGSRIAWVALFGMGLAVGLGLFAASGGATLLLSFALTVCIACPFAVLWHLSPREATVRRMRFAQLLSHEISKRRGGGKGTMTPTSSRLVFEGLWGQATPSSSEGAMSRTVMKQPLYH